MSESFPITEKGYVEAIQILANFADFRSPNSVSDFENSPSDSSVPVQGANDAVRKNQIHCEASPEIIDKEVDDPKNAGSTKSERILPEIRENVEESFLNQKHDQKSTIIRLDKKSHEKIQIARRFEPVALKSQSNLQRIHQLIGVMKPKTI